MKRWGWAAHAFPEFEDNYVADEDGCVGKCIDWVEDSDGIQLKVEPIAVDIENDELDGPVELIGGECPRRSNGIFSRATKKLQFTPKKSGFNFSRGWSRDELPS